MTNRFCLQNQSLNPYCWEFEIKKYQNTLPHEDKVALQPPLKLERTYLENLGNLKKLAIPLNPYNPHLQYSTLTKTFRQLEEFKKTPKQINDHDKLMGEFLEGAATLGLMILIGVATGGTASAVATAIIADSATGALTASGIVSGVEIATGAAPGVSAASAALYGAMIAIMEGFGLGGLAGGAKCVGEAYQQGTNINLYDLKHEVLKYGLLGATAAFGSSATEGIIKTFFTNKIVLSATEQTIVQTTLDGSMSGSFSNVADSITKQYDETGSVDVEELMASAGEGLLFGTIGGAFIGKGLPLLEKTVIKAGEVFTNTSQKLFGFGSKILSTSTPLIAEGLTDITNQTKTLALSATKKLLLPPPSTAFETRKNIEALFETFYQKINEMESHNFNEAKKELKTLVENYNLSAEHLTEAKISGHILNRLQTALDSPSGLTGFQTTVKELRLQVAKDIFTSYVPESWRVRTLLGGVLCHPAEGIRRVPKALLEDAQFLEFHGGLDNLHKELPHNQMIGLLEYLLDIKLFREGITSADVAPANVAENLLEHLDDKTINKILQFFGTAPETDEAKNLFTGWAKRGWNNSIKIVTDMDDTTVDSFRGHFANNLNSPAFWLKLPFAGAQFLLGKSYWGLEFQAQSRPIVPYIFNTLRRGQIPIQTDNIPELVTCMLEMFPTLRFALGSKLPYQTKTLAEVVADPLIRTAREFGENIGQLVTKLAEKGFDALTLEDQKAIAAIVFHKKGSKLKIPTVSGIDRIMDAILIDNAPYYTKIWATLGRGAVQIPDRMMSLLGTEGNYLSDIGFGAINLFFRKNFLRLEHLSTKLLPSNLDVLPSSKYGIWKEIAEQLTPTVQISEKKLVDLTQTSIERANYSSEQPKRLYILFEKIKTLFTTNKFLRAIYSPLQNKNLPAGALVQRGSGILSFDAVAGFVKLRREALTAQKELKRLLEKQGNLEKAREIFQHL